MSEIKSNPVSTKSEADLPVNNPVAAIIEGTNPISIFQLTYRTKGKIYFLQFQAKDKLDAVENAKQWCMHNKCYYVNVQAWLHDIVKEVKEYKEKSKKAEVLERSETLRIREGRST